MFLLLSDSCSDYDDSCWNNHDLCGWNYPIRPERAEAPSPGRRPGWLWTPTCRPERAKALKNPAINNSFALTGRLVACYYTQGDALGCELLGFQPVSTVHFGYFLLSPVLEIGPWVNPINDRLMFRLTMINVKNKSPFMFRFSKIQVNPSLIPH